MAKEEEVLRVIGECYPTNVYYDSLPPDNDGVVGGTIWQGTGWSMLSEMRYNVPKKQDKKYYNMLL
jgi:hypothetical protein